MAVQAPNTRLGSPRPYGLEERIRQLMEQRQVVPVDRPVDELAPFRTDDTQRIVRDASQEEVPVVDLTPTADQIIRDEEGPRPAPPRPFPPTAAERVADLRRQLQPQVNAQRARVKAAPVMTIDGEPEPDLAIPDPITGFKPKPAELDRKPKPGATQTAGFYVAPGRADEAGRAVGKGRREEREKNEAVAAEKAKNEADLAAEDAELEASGLIDERGRPIRSNIVAKHQAGPDGEIGNEDDGPDLNAVPQPAWSPAAPGTGYVGRRAGQPFRHQATPEELRVPLNERRFVDDDGNRPPMLPGRGQFAEPNSGLNRAPQGAMMDYLVAQDARRKAEGKPALLTTMPANESVFQEWKTVMMQLAMAAGIDIEQYENEQDLLNAGSRIATQFERMNAPVTNRVPKTVTTAGPDGLPGTDDDETTVARDQNGNVILTKQVVTADGAPVPKYKPGITRSGAPAYLPSQAHSQASVDQMRRASARQFVRDHKPDEQTGKAIMDAADMGDFDAVASLIRGARRDRTASTAQAAMDQARLRGQTQNMNNPRLNRAMFHESVMRQPNAAGVAQVATGWGAAGGIPAMISAEAVAADKAARDADREVTRDVGLANATARDKNQDGLRNYQAQVNGILTSSPDPITAINQLRTVNAAAAEGGIIPKQDVEYQTHAEVSRNEIRSGRGPNNFATQNGLKMLFDKVYTVGTAAGEAMGTVGDRRQEFIRRAQLDLGCDEATADAYLSSRGQ